MRRTRAIGAVVVAVALLTSCTGDPTESDDERDGRPVKPGPVQLLPEPATAPPPEQVAAELQILVDEVVEIGLRVPGLSRGAPGLAAAIVTDEWAWAGSAGVDGSGQPVLPDSMMAIGGITKTFMAAEVLHLASEGAIELEAPLSRYVNNLAVDDAAIVEQALGMREPASGTRVFRRRGPRRTLLGTGRPQRSSSCSPARLPCRPPTTRCRLLTGTCRIARWPASRGERAAWQETRRPWPGGGTCSTGATCWRRRGSPG